MDSEDLDERDEKLLNIPGVKEALKEIKALPWKFIDDLQPGDLLRIRTAQEGNYLMQVVDPKQKTVRIVEPDPKVSKQTLARLLGSKVISADGGMILKIGGIAVGFSILIATENEAQGLILPPTEEVYLNAEKILPDFSNIVPGKK